MRKRTFFFPFIVLAVAGCDAVPAGVDGVSSLETALWLSGWGLICLLGAALFAFRARLVLVRNERDRCLEMVEEVNSIIMRLKKDGTILYLNRFGLEFFGWSEEELLGQNVNGTLIPETGTDGRKMRFVWKEVVAHAGDSSAFENENQCKDGGRVWVAWSNKLVENRDGGEQEILSVGTDCTSLHEKSKMLRQIRLSALNAPYPIAITDLEGRAQFVNAPWLQGTQYDSPQEVIGKKIDLFQRARCQGEAYVDELRERLRRDGEISADIECGEMFMRLTINTIRDSKGVATGYRSTVPDITPEKLAARQAEQARVQAEASERTKSFILSNISHEIRTPLNGVLGMLQILLMGRLDETQKEQVETAMDSAKDLNAIIESILTYSEIDSDSFTLDPQPFSLASMVLALLEKYRGEAQKRGLVLCLEAEPGLQDGLLGDGHRIRQVIDILLGNAIKFTHDGSVTMRLATPFAGEAGKVQFSLAVEDTGVGIAKDRMESILTGFVQGDQTYSRRFGGLGLGLGMAQKLAEAMGGGVTIQSREGEGSTVTLTLPLKALDAAQGGQSLVLAPLQALGRRPLVLLALEQNRERARLKLYLQSRGVDVLVAEGVSGGVAALEQADRAEVHLAVFHLHEEQEQAAMDALGAEKSVPLVLLGSDLDHVCPHASVVARTSYPVAPERIWELLLDALA